MRNALSSSQTFQVPNDQGFPRFIQEPPSPRCPLLTRAAGLDSRSHSSGSSLAPKSQVTIGTANTDTYDPDLYKEAPAVGKFLEACTSSIGHIYTSLTGFGCRSEEDPRKIVRLSPEKRKEVLREILEVGGCLTKLDLAVLEDHFDKFLL
ncbi:hypothetical protein CPB84DRAFT_189269 [Gymnopilus junonius]|uniref:Uncharacterized protein n=1 Tax=Gymnopilus junonius TaxID=109634 RepID=A0A9P5NFK8_GYMJU|nr:hypothetical protein CPB84DRAFT_189269 [Gymnopilus junonius]